jgi:hypothetical protein
MGGLAGADALCQQQAARSHLPGTYMAWLSDDTESPETRFLLKSSGPYWTAGRQLIADNWTDLTSGGLERAIALGVYPFDLPSIDVAWTNTLVNGTSPGAAGAHCQNWSSSGSDAGNVGHCGVTTTAWTEAGGRGMTCLLSGKLYCFQQS